MYLTGEERALGSSPLARGLQMRDPVYTPMGGIIPARAGFTDGDGVRRGAVQDHPRSRGVYRCGTPCTRRWAGSSPLARGLPTVTASAEAQSRIIPARAGFTLPWKTLGCNRSDHPRSRGVYRASLARVCDW